MALWSRNVVIAAVIASTAAYAQAQTVTLFGNAAPHSPVNPDSAVTLGIKFYSTQAGTIAGIRFYRGAKNNNGYTVKLFSAAGSLLASARASKDVCTVPCWEQINFAAPLSIAANTTYVAAYYTSNGNYADDTGTNGGLTHGLTSGPLVAPDSGVSGGNGVYVYSTGFPNHTWQDSNYYVDVSFTPTMRQPYLTLTFSPSNPSVPATTPLGSPVARITADWSDDVNGSHPFTGTLGFTAPYSNDAGTFAISGTNLIINPAGPGVSGDGGTFQNVSIQAVQ